MATTHAEQKPRAKPAVVWLLVTLQKKTLFHSEWQYRNKACNPAFFKNSSKYCTFGPKFRGGHLSPPPYLTLATALHFECRYPKCVWLNAAVAICQRYRLSEDIALLMYTLMILKRSDRSRWAWIVVQKCKIQYDKWNDESKYKSKDHLFMFKTTILVNKRKRIYCIISISDKRLSSFFISLILTLPFYYFLLFSLPFSF